MKYNISKNFDSKTIKGDFVMNDKRKEELIKIYNDIADDRETYIKLYKDFEEYQLDLENIFENHINKYSSIEEQIRLCLGMLNAKKQIVFLGMIEAIKQDNYAYLDRALNTYVKFALLVVLKSNNDHCCFSLNYIPYLLVLNRFADIEKIYPKNCGLSKSKSWGGIVTNLIMYLYYQEKSWSVEVLDAANKYLSRKNSLEYQAIVEALVSLVNKDFEQFSISLNNCCKGRKKSKEFEENKFSKSFSFYSLGLYNFAEYLYLDEIDKIVLPNDEVFLQDYCLYQHSQTSLDKGYIIRFNEKLSLLKVLFEVDTPNITLVKNGKSYEVDCCAYNDEILNKVKEIVSN